MDESTQQIIALGIVALVVATELWRRWRKRTAGKAGCDGCDTPTSANKNAGEAPVRFYRRSR